MRIKNPESQVWLHFSEFTLLKSVCCFFLGKETSAYSNRDYDFHRYLIQVCLKFLTNCFLYTAYTFPAEMYQHLM